MRKRVALLGATGSIGASTAGRDRAPSASASAARALSAHRDVDDLVARCRALAPALRRDRRPALRRRAGARPARGRTADPSRWPAQPRWRPSPPAAGGRHRGRRDRRRGGPGSPRWPPRARASACCWPTRKRWSWPAPCWPRRWRRGGGTLLPIDSEHNAIFQCLPPGYARDPGAPWRRAHHPDRLGRAVPRLDARRSWTR